MCKFLNVWFHRLNDNKMENKEMMVWSEDEIMKVRVFMGEIHGDNMMYLGCDHGLG